MKILKSSNRLETLEYVKDLLWDKQTLKELGEPIIFSEGQRWLLSFEGKVLTGFLVYEEASTAIKLQYLYVLPDFRRLKVATKLYREFENQKETDKPIRAIATKMSLEFYKKLGYSITKEFVNYFKVEKK